MHDITTTIVTKTSVHGMLLGSKQFLEIPLKVFQDF